MNDKKANRVHVEEIYTFLVLFDDDHMNLEDIYNGFLCNLDKY